MPALRLRTLSLVLASLWAGTIAAPAQSGTPSSEPPLTGLVVPAGASEHTVVPAPVHSSDSWSEPAAGHVGEDGSHDSLKPGRVWFDADYLLWRVKGSSAPALVSTGPPTGTATTAALGAPGTVLLDDGSGLAHGTHSGARFFAGTWFGCDATWGIEAGYFFLTPHTSHFGASSPGSPVLARPFFDVSTGLETSEVTAFVNPAVSPLRASGSIFIAASDHLQSFEVNPVYNLVRSSNFEVNALVGFRYLNLHEGLGIHEQVSVAPGSGTPFDGASIDILDQFDTRNEFYGGQIGARAEYHLGNLIVSALGKVALGSTRETLNVGGSTRLTPGPVVPGGLLALMTNSGDFSRDQFAVVPEANLQIGYQLAPGVRASAGYSFLYWSNVARAGEQVPNAINATQVPTNVVTGGNLIGQPVPLPGIQRNTDFWAQGLTFGLQLRY